MNSLESCGAFPGILQSLACRRCFVGIYCMNELVSFHVDVPYPASAERLTERDGGGSRVLKCVLSVCFTCSLVNFMLLPWLKRLLLAGEEGVGLWELQPLDTLAWHAHPFFPWAGSSS